MLFKILRATILILLSHSFIFGQKIIYRKPKVDKEKKLIYIPYEIKESSKIQNVYYLELYYTQGKSDSLIGPLQQVMGDIGADITPGKKLAVWHYWAEKHDDDPNYVFTGQDIRFTFKVVYNANPNYLMGPEAALYSLAFPGLGNTKVRPKYERKHWYIIPVVTAGLVGTGFLYRSRAEQTLNQYRQSRTIDEAQDLFTKSNNQKRTSGMLIVAGGLVWLGDITQVFIRGLKNKKRQKEFNAKPPKPSPEIGVMQDYVQDRPTFGIKIKF